MASDVQRYLGVTRLADVEARVARGREMLRAWLALVALTTEPTEGCDRCGRRACNTATCAAASAEITEIRGRVPLDVVHQMDPPRWRRAIAFIDRSPVVLSIFQERAA